CSLLCWIRKAHNTNGLSPLHLVVLIGSGCSSRRVPGKGSIVLQIPHTIEGDSLSSRCTKQKRRWLHFHGREAGALTAQKLLQQVDVNGILSYISLPPCLVVLR
ncbi:hypothetical protein HID58_094557, partial [Brassica napus]